MYNYNFINNTAQLGGAIFIFDSALNLIGSDDSILPSVIQNNRVSNTGGFIFGSSSNININNYNMINNYARYGGAV